MNSPKPLQLIAYDYIKNQILNNDFSYNKIYSETQLSKEIGISRTPVRDAIHRLSQEKYIDIIPSKGIRIHQLSQQDVIETFQVRSAIEGYCALQISLNCSSPEAHKLFDKLEKLQQILIDIAGTTRNTTEFADYDGQFHAEIVSHIHNSAINNMFHNYLYQIKRLASLSLQHGDRMNQTIQEHNAIISCMKNGNSSDVYDAILAHMALAQEVNLQELE